MVAGPWPRECGDRAFHSSEAETPAYCQLALWQKTIKGALPLAKPGKCDYLCKRTANTTSVRFPCCSCSLAALLKSHARSITQRLQPLEIQGITRN